MDKNQILFTITVVGAIFGAMTYFYEEVSSVRADTADDYRSLEERLRGMEQKQSQMAESIDIMKEILLKWEKIYNP